MILPENSTVDTSDAEAMAALANPSAAFGTSTRPIVQNLGPGTVYLGTAAADLDLLGLKLPVNAVYELPDELFQGPGRIFLMAVDDDCDVRIINVG